MKQTFTARLFVTLEYKRYAFKRDSKTTLQKYLEDMRKNGVEILETIFIKTGSSGAHDGFAFGDHYKVTGAVDFCRNKGMTTFRIYHKSRLHDYFNANPITYSSIKLIEAPRNI